MASRGLKKQLVKVSKESLYRLAERHYNGQVRATRALIAVLVNLGGKGEFIQKDTLEGIPGGSTFAIDETEDGWTVRLVLPEPAPEPSIVLTDKPVVLVEPKVRPLVEQ